MNPNDNPYSPTGDSTGAEHNDQLFAPRFSVPNANTPPNAAPPAQNGTNGQNISMPSNSMSGQGLPGNAPRTASTYPWAPTPANQPHPAQPASPVSNEHFPPPPPPINPHATEGSLPQYGGQMAELPPLAVSVNPQLPAPQVAQSPLGTPPKPKKSKMKLLFGSLIALAFLALVGAAILVVLESSNKKDTTTKTTPKAVTYTTDQVKKLAASKQLTAAELKKLDSTNTFYSAFRTAAQQSTVQTTWDVYYTKGQKDARADQYSLYSVAVDYRNKAYTYDEDDYSNIGTIQTRCLGNKQYIYNASKLSDAEASWQQASDSTNCSLSSVATRMNDGMNTGGLDAKQSDTFVQQLNKTGVLKVTGMSLATQKDAQYIKFDVTVTPQPKTTGVYWGVQNFMAAFESTGLNPAKYPYTYFGASGEGMQLSYYVNPATMLPVYSTSVSTPAFNAKGKAVAPASWSHRFVEYQFPSEVAKANLENHDLLAFKLWADH